MAERILCVLGKLRAGGVESIMFSYYRCLDKSKYQYDFIYEEGSDSDVPSDIIEMGARSFKVPGIGSPFRYMREVRRIIKREGYRIVHANLNTLSVFSLFCAKTCGVKYRILHNHTTSSPVEKKRTFLKKILRPFNLMFANRPCACSLLAARWMYGDRAVDRGEVKIFRNGVNVELFSFDESSREEIRREFKLENKKVIGHVGRFVTTKNHLFMIDIFEKYLSINEDSCLFLVGNGELFDDVKEYARKKGVYDKVIFAGTLRDVHRYYSAFDVFVLPSLYEGLPLVAMEACACGLPVLLSDKITKECAISDNVSFISIDSPDPWVKAIDSCECTDRSSVAEVMAQGAYSIYNCVKELEAYYDSCK